MKLPWNRTQNPTATETIERLKEQHRQFLKSIPELRKTALEIPGPLRPGFVEYLDGMEKELKHHFRVEEEIVFPVIEIISSRSVNPLVESLGIVCQNIKEDHHVHQRMITDLRHMGAGFEQDAGSEFSALLHCFTASMEKHVAVENDYLFAPFIATI